MGVMVSYKVSVRLRKMLHSSFPLKDVGQFLLNECSLSRACTSSLQALDLIAVVPRAVPQGDQLAGAGKEWTR